MGTMWQFGPGANDWAGPIHNSPDNRECAAAPVVTLEMTEEVTVGCSPIQVAHTLTATHEWGLAAAFFGWRWAVLLLVVAIHSKYRYTGTQYTRDLVR